MTLSKIALLTSVSTIAAIGPMSATERSRGRYMRDEGGHAPAPTPTPTPAPAADSGEGGDGLETAESLAAEFGQDGEPATPKADDGDATKDEEDGLDKTEAPKGKSAEERIAEQTALQRNAERDAAEARRETERLRAEVARLTPPPADGVKEVDPWKEPSPDDYEYGEADTGFIRDTAAHAARVEFATQQRQAEVKTQLADLEAGYAERAAKPEFLEARPDFEEKVVKGAEENKWDCSPIMALGLKHSEFGPEIAYQLASDPAEATRIANLTNLEQARELGKMEGQRIAARKSAAEDGKPEPKTNTSAPPPPANRARGAGGQFTTEDDTGDFRAFEAKADAILKG